MIEGALIYDPGTGRLDIITRDGEAYGGLHCGNVIEIQNESGGWESTRVEYAGDEWFLDGMYGPGQIPYDLRVRMRR